MESKCPLCGDELYVDTPDPEDESAVYAFYDCLGCFFACEINDLPRIAAAMELAKAFAQKEKLSGDEMFKVPITEDRLEQAKALNKQIDTAFLRVLEVFGGE